ncbi:unnamed protein product [Periconia digitata]|uniref:Acetyltransferase n=1 Tax=Periconia digitata TaxID=1303443 RepID=A0A9W4XY28_9PLEO|nr:unnamed protein product [Periconia digitata]
MPPPGQLLHALIAVLTATLGFIADWNHTHVYNPRWPPHAKFHNGQTMSTGLLLGGTALFHLFVRPLANPRDNLNVVSWILCLNYVAQVSAVFYPGSLPIDPEFAGGPGGAFPQAYGAAVLVGVVGVGYWLEEARIRRLEGNVVKAK